MKTSKQQKYIRVPQHSKKVDGKKVVVREHVRSAPCRIQTSK